MKLASNKHYKENKSNKPNNGMGKQTMKKKLFQEWQNVFLKVTSEFVDLNFVYMIKKHF